jgi:ribonuclease Z
VEVKLGKVGKQLYVIDTVQLMHTVSTVGYIVSERRVKMIPEVLQRLENECGNKKDLGKRIQMARSSGEVLERIEDSPVCAFICDTTAEALRPGAGLHAEQILASPVVLVECTYLEESFSAQAGRKGHVVWEGASGLGTIVKQHLFPSPLCDNHSDKTAGGGAGAGDVRREGPCSCSSSAQPQTTFVLIHFSLRYSDAEIRNFFLNAGRTGLGSSVSTEDGGWGVPPHLVLWLDTGVVQLWYQ